MNKKTLKFNNIRDNKKKFDMSKKAIGLMSVNINKINVSDKLKYLLAIKNMKLLDRYVLFYLKWPGI